MGTRSPCTIDGYGNAIATDCQCLWERDRPVQLMTMEMRTPERLRYSTEAMAKLLEDNR